MMSGYTAMLCLLPAFLAAFARNRRLSGEELDEVQRMIDEFRDGGHG